MKKFNLNNLISELQEDHREFGMADTIFTYFKYKHLPIKIDGVIKNELKEFKASFCIYDGYIEDYGVYDYKQDVELLILQEYDDSPLSIYINENGEVDSYEYENINTIEIGDSIVLKVEDGFLTHYSIKKRSCIYCEDSQPSTHFICEVCGAGMCDDCYNNDIDHTLHYQNILENCDDEREIELITKACGRQPDYICETCVNEILEEKSTEKGKIK